MNKEKVYNDEFELADEHWPTTTFWEKKQEEKIQEIINAGGKTDDLLDILFAGQYRVVFNAMVNKDTNHRQLFVIYRCIENFLLSWLLEQKLVYDDTYLDKGKDVTDAYKKEICKAEFIYLEYLEKLGNIHTENNNQNEMELIYVKDFPENTTNEQKKILSLLAGCYLIHPKLLQNNKYKPFKERDIKDVIRKLYKIVPNYTHENAFAFMTLFIETCKEGSVIQNYCREIKKDMPI